MRSRNHEPKCRRIAFTFWPCLIFSVEYRLLSLLPQSGSEISEYYNYEPMVSISDALLQQRIFCENL